MNQDAYLKQMSMIEQNDMIRSDSKRNAKTNAVIRPQLRIKCLILNGHL